MKDGRMNKRQRKKALKRKLAENFLLWFDEVTKVYHRLTWKDVKVTVERRKR